MTAMDDGVDKLQAYCDLLETTNPALATGTADLGRLAQDLSDSEGRLSTELAALDGEVDGLQKEAETSEAAAVKACQELASACEQEVKTELPEMEQQMAADKDEWVKDLDQKAAALETGFVELESQAFTPLDTVLDSERRDFDRWMNEADTALVALAKALEQAAQEVEQGGTSAAEPWADAPCFDHAFWQPAKTQAEKVGTEVVQAFRAAKHQEETEAKKTYDDVTEYVQGQAIDVRASLEKHAGTAAAAIQTETQEVTQAVDTAVAELDETKTAFDTAAMHGEDAEPRAASLMELGPRIEAADVKLEEIRAAMEAMGS
jgi:hypothetical protein